MLACKNNVLSFAFYILEVSWKNEQYKERGNYYGASSGLGAEYAKLLDKEGLDELWLIARRKERLDSLAPDWLKGDNYFVNYNSKWLRTGYDSNDKYGWMAKIFAEGIENARKNQRDLDERMGTLNDILQNSREAEGNMEVM